jgi:hypothetical protein
MTRANITRGAFAALVVLLAAAGFWLLKPESQPAAAKFPAAPPSTSSSSSSSSPLEPGTQPGFLYGRITTVDGATFEGRLRWGGDQEAFWSDYFNGAKLENRWATQVPPERLPKVLSPIEVFGVEITRREKPMDLGRLFMARFGDIARIESPGRKEVRVTLKSGTTFVLARMEASDFDDGVRVWDGMRGVVDLDSLRIRTIELLPVPTAGAAPSRLYGTVRTRQGAFTGFLQWDREECVGTDEIHGRAANGPRNLRFATIRAIARASTDSSRVTLLDGSEVVLSGAPDVGKENRGIYVDDPRYGRVLVSWDAFVRVDFTAPDAPDVPGQGASGPAYGDFPRGRPLQGSVTTRAGRQIAGRLVYDLDESETTETLDAPSQGVDYTLPFERLASIVVTGPEEPARVTLQSGEELRLDHEGDLGENNAGLLIFVAGNSRPEYVRWAEVARVDFDRPAATQPPPGELPSPATPSPSKAIVERGAPSTSRVP